MFRAGPAGAGSGVAVGRIGVPVGDDVSVGGADVAVSGMGVALGGTGVGEGVAPAQPVTRARTTPQRISEKHLFKLSSVVGGQQNGVIH